MLPRLIPCILAVALLFGGAACEKKKTSAERQKEIADVFRRKQKIEAIKAYTDLVNKFPDSEYAAKAQERLTVLGPLPTTPAPKKN